MCGFLAVIGQSLPKLRLDAAGAVLSHRGPDSHHALEKSGLYMAFHRLAIIDTAARSDQPMSDESDQVTIVFNGEIYNYRDLREDLQLQGCRFRTQGDTEVILNGYLRHGMEFVNKLEGMFAFVIHDLRLGKAFAVRDHYGIKPLYFHKTAAGCVYASEQRPIRRLFDTPVDPGSVAELILFRWATAPRSNYKGIELVEPGTYHAIDLRDRGITRHQYYRAEQTFSAKQVMRPEEAIDIAEAAIRQSVKAHLTSDVGASLLLSGGVDSSLVGAISREFLPNLESFGITFPDQPHDEGAHQLAVAKAVGLRHHSIALRGEDLASVMREATYQMDGPLPHYGCGLLYLAYRKIKPLSSVVLTGEGADELFGGYRRYRDIARLTRYHRLGRLVPGFIQNKLPRFRAVWHHSAADPAIAAAVYQDFRKALLLAESVSPEVMVLREAVAAVDLDNASRWFYLDQRTYLPSLLMRQDRMSMAHGVEARVPFVHRPLIDLVNAIPDQTKLFEPDTKPILKAIARRYLPHSVIDRRKVGLTLPLAEWVQDGQPLAPLKEAALEEGAPIQAFVSRGVMLDLQHQIQSGHAEEAKQAGDVMANLVNINCWLSTVSA